MLDSQRYSYKFYLINIMEEMVVCSKDKNDNSDNACMFFCSRNAQISFLKENMKKINSFQNINIAI